MSEKIPKLKSTRLSFAYATALVSVFVAALTSVKAQAEPKLVLLRTIDPSIAQAIAYYTTDNFTGRPVPGYKDGECRLTQKAATALAQVQERLRPRGLSLVVFDCYRPLKAVLKFVEWTKDPELQIERNLKHFSPRTKAADLIRQGYIAKRSSHTTGNTVDVGLVTLGETVIRTNTLDVACTAEGATPAPLLDMGTSFDCFDRKSHAVSRRVTRQQNTNRVTLRKAMVAEGFKPYRREWWHFSYRSR